MNLAQAQRYADQILPWLAPYCERIEIVGSIRRRRPVCNDIDLVCIPRVTSETRKVDMFTTEQVATSQLRQFLVSYVAAGNACWLPRAPQAGRAALPSPGGEGQGEGGLSRAATLAGQGEGGLSGPVPKLDAQNLLLQLKRCQLDIFCGTDETFATLKLCRTGSKEHNIWLCDRAKTFGGHWNPYKGLTLRDGLVHATSEEEIYAALKLPFITPENRELDYLRRLR